MRTRYVFVALGVLALTLGASATPAFADPHGDRGRGGDMHGGWHEGGGPRGDNGGGWGRDRWSHGDWHDHPGFQPGYYAPPPVYYPPPPQPIYAPPGINMFMPFR